MSLLAWSLAVALGLWALSNHVIGARNGNDGARRLRNAMAGLALMFVGLALIL
ncbi:hypothetical protein [Dermacoccus sp. 147Ba]|uniref:hypothetical protein n=1 Tax=Dermacoccus sp. 147Ba TaxID=2510111 RepID=UPI0013ED58A4|nr:hypothetical protein [Dermacoccus sp. 147Ba]